MGEDKTKVNSILMHSGLIADICQPIIQRLNICNVGYYELHENGEYIFLNSNPEYINDAINAGLMLRTPRIVMQAYPKLGFYLLDSDKCTQKHIKEYIDIRTRFNYGHSFRLIDKVKDSSSHQILKLYSFEAQLGHSEVNQNYINNIDLIKQFTHYFSNRIALLTQAKNRLKMNLDCQTELVRYLYDSDSYIEKISSFIFDCNLNASHERETREDKRVRLTPREKQIIMLYLEGKTAKETAQTLLISKRTVERYFEILREKFHCKSKSQLVIKLLYQKLMH